MRARSPAISLCCVLATLMLAACGGGDDGDRGRTATTATERGWFAYGVQTRPPPALSGDALAVWRRGQAAFNESGCLACHRIGRGGSDGPGPDLTHVGGRLSAEQIRDVLLNPTPPMPSFGQLSERDPRTFSALVDYVDTLE